MSHVRKAIGIAGVAATLAACTGSDRPVCAPGMGRPMALFTLYLGKAIPGRGNLTDTEWQSFLDDTVTANLPDGYTILDAGGAWMNPLTRRTASEATKVLVSALPNTSASLAAVNRVRTIYQTRFNQQLVGMTVEQACATF